MQPSTSQYSPPSLLTLSNLLPYLPFQKPYSLLCLVYYCFFVYRQLKRDLLSFIIMFDLQAVEKRFFIIFIIFCLQAVETRLLNENLHRLPNTKHTGRFFCVQPNIFHFSRVGQSAISTLSAFQTGNFEIFAR